MTVVEKRAQHEILLPASARWWVLLISTAVMFVITMLLIAALSGVMETEAPRLLTGSMLQGLLVFIVPVLVTWRLTVPDPGKISGLAVAPGWRNVLWMILLYAVAFPGMNQVIWWNSSMHLPESMSALEEALRAMEDAAAASTDILFDSDSVGRLMVNLLIIGLFTGFAEEMFFRAGLQRMLVASGVRTGWAIWIAALIFTTMHFQFFGFVPRLLLGAMFGYVYARTGSVWTAASMHALNNCLVVICRWLENRGIVTSDLDTLFVSETGFPVMFVVSLLAVTGFLIADNNRSIFKRQK